MVSSLPVNLILRAASSARAIGKLGEIRNRHAIHFDGEAFRTQTLAVAHRTFRRRHEIQHVFAVVVRSGRFEILPEVAEDSQEPGFASALRLAVQQQVLNFVGKLFERRRQIEPVGLHQQLNAAHQILRRRTRPEAAIKNRLRPIDNHFSRIKIVAASQTVALRACSIGTVERERARLQLRHADAAVGTG